MQPRSTPGTREDILTRVQDSRTRWAHLRRPIHVRNGTILAPALVVKRTDPLNALPFRVVPR